LLVVDQAHQRPPLRHLRQQAQGGQPDDETIRHRPGGDAEDGGQRVALRSWKTVEVPQHRCAELVQRGEGELHLGLDPRCPGQLTVDGALGDVLHQSRLAHARLAVDKKGTACPGADFINQSVEVISLGASTLEVGPVRCTHGFALPGILSTY
jgi:hypothetical protein